MVHFCADVRMLNNSGIGVYVQKYIQSILRHNLFKVTLIGRKKEVNSYFGEYSNWRHVEADFPIYSITEQLKLPWLIPTCDVFWSPHYNIPMLPIRARRRLVTIPDVYHLAFYHTLSLAQKVYARVVVIAATRIANKITTISQYSKQEIERYTGADGSKIEVLYLGIDTTLFQAISSSANQERVKVKYNLPNQYVLFVGNVKPNKNLSRLVDGFAQLLVEFPELSLVITGKQEGFITGDPALFARINDDKVLESRIVFTGFVDMIDLPILYSSAYLFAFPSIYEGFGFPPLEAMACGCPVVASKAASIPEICGEAALYVDPLDPTDIAKGIRTLAEDDEFRGRLIKMGHQQCQQYNWDKSFDRFIELINVLAHH